jgi:HD superfamily phosphohydrolase YqeK
VDQDTSQVFGLEVDAELVERACLLHDILRICEVPDYSSVGWPATDEHKARWQQLKREYSGLSHEDAAFRLLEKQYPELAEAVRKHLEGAWTLVSRSWICAVEITGSLSE